MLVLVRCSADGRKDVLLFEIRKFLAFWQGVIFVRLFIRFLDRSTRITNYNIATI